MNKIVLKAKIVNGEIHYYRPSALKEFIKDNESKSIIITHEIEDPEASSNAHGYYRIINRWLSKETELYGGWDEQDIHDYAIDVCGTTIKQIRKGDEFVEVHERLSLSRISVKKMREFMDKWLMHLAKEGIYPPEPEQL